MREREGAAEREGRKRSKGGEAEDNRARINYKYQAKLLINKYRKQLKEATRRSPFVAPERRGRRRDLQHTWCSA